MFSCYKNQQGFKTIRLDMYAYNFRNMSMQQCITIQFNLFHKNTKFRTTEGVVIITALGQSH